MLDIYAESVQCISYMPCASYNLYTSNLCLADMQCLLNTWKT